jgi:hypothetical protein
MTEYVENSELYGVCPVCRGYLVGRQVIGTPGYEWSCVGGQGVTDPCLKVWPAGKKGDGIVVLNTPEGPEQSGVGEVPAKKRMPMYDSEGAKLLFKLEEAETELKEAEKARAWFTVPAPFALATLVGALILDAVAESLEADISYFCQSLAIASFCVIVISWLLYAVRSSGQKPLATLRKTEREARAEYHDHQGRRLDVQYRLDAGIWVSRREVEGKSFDPFTGYGW